MFEIILNILLYLKFIRFSEMMKVAAGKINPGQVIEIGIDISQEVHFLKSRTKGFGSSDPVGDNDTEEGRFQNRRVDLIILKRDMSKALNPEPPAPEATP